MPYHYDGGGEYSYHSFNDGEQWYDYSGGLIFGYNLKICLNYTINAFFFGVNCSPLVLFIFVLYIFRTF